MAPTPRPGQMPTPGALGGGGGGGGGVRLPPPPVVPPLWNGAQTLSNYEDSTLVETRKKTKAYTKLD